MRYRQILTSARLLSALVLAAFGHSALLAFMQNSTTCPTPKYLKNQWPQNSTVYYDTAGLDDAQKSAADQALKDWNTANQTNGSGIVFSPATAQNPANLVFGNNSVIVPGTSTSCTPSSTQGALECASVPSGSSNNSSAAIVFNRSATIKDSNPPQPVYDPNAANYTTFLQKVARHEIGHTMGL